MGWNARTTVIVVFVSGQDRFECVTDVTCDLTRIRFLIFRGLSIVPDARLSVPIKSSRPFSPHVHNCWPSLSPFFGIIPTNH